MDPFFPSFCFQCQLKIWSLEKRKPIICTFIQVRCQTGTGKKDNENHSSSEKPDYSFYNTPPKNVQLARMSQLPKYLEGSQQEQGNWRRERERCTRHKAGPMLVKLALHNGEDVFPLLAIESNSISGPRQLLGMDLEGMTFCLFFFLPFPSNKISFVSSAVVKPCLFVKSYVFGFPGDCQGCHGSDLLNTKESSKIWQPALLFLGGCKATP